MKTMQKQRSTYGTTCIYVLTERIVLETPWNDSVMQGQEGFGSSMRHGHIIARFLRRSNAEFPDIVSSHAQSLTNIDDIIFALFYKGGLAKNDASKIFSMLEQTYLELGYTVDRTKSILRSNKFIYLSRYFARGIEILMPLKVVIRSALLYKNSLPDVSSNWEAISGICRAIERQSGTAVTSSVYYNIRCAEEVATLIGRDSETFPDVLSRGIVMALPYCFGGLAMKDFASCVRGGSKVSSLSICEVLDAGIAMNGQLVASLKASWQKDSLAISLVVVVRCEAFFSFPDWLSRIVSHLSHSKTLQWSLTFRRSLVLIAEVSYTCSDHCRLSKKTRVLEFLLFSETDEICQIVLGHQTCFLS